MVQIRLYNLSISHLYRANGKMFAGYILTKLQLIILVIHKVTFSQRPITHSLLHYIEDQDKVCLRMCLIVVNETSLVHHTILKITFIKMKSLQCILICRVFTITHRCVVSLVVDSRAQYLRCYVVFMTSHSSSIENTRV